MHYHWGLGVGHLHAHHPVSTSNGCSVIHGKLRDIEDDQNADCEPDNASEDAPNIDGTSSDMYNSDKSEWDLDNHDLEGWEDEETDSGNDIDCRSRLDSKSALIMLGCSCSMFNSHHPVQCMYMQNTHWYKHSYKYV